MSRTYISSIIGNDYKNWEADTSVIIASPTGTGKSTFVLQILLPYAMAAGKHIVYVCNRKILKEQFYNLSQRKIKEIFGPAADIPESSLPFIHVVTYQYCETANQFLDFQIPPDLSGLSRKEKIIQESQHNLPQATPLKRNEIMYYVFDEAHYFIADALFNADTNYWYGKNFTCGNICIFLTATPEPLMCFLACRQKPDWILATQVADQLKKKSSKRESMNKWFDIKIDLKNKSHEFIVNSQRAVDEQCRQIQPFEAPISQLKQFVSQEYQRSSGYSVYDLQTDYSYVTPVYFSNYTQLLDVIFQSQEKWLIFVDYERDGIDLVGRLNQGGTEAVFLSAKTCRSKRCDAYYEFLNIVQTQKFNCKVLVATSVLDCGVNISDSLVKNVVIGHSDKTTFLQMLGRKRVTENESITLYIKAFQSKTINALRYNCEKKLHFIISFSLINDISYDKVMPATASDDGMIPHTTLPAQTINQVVQLLPENGTLIWSPTLVAAPVIRQYGKITADHAPGILKEYRYSKTALISLLYSFSNYQDAVEDHRETKDPAFYLKRQLSWLGKAYNEAQWLGYSTSIAVLDQYIRQYLDIPLFKGQQEEFTQGLLLLLAKHPVPISEIKTACSTYEKDHKKLPGKHKLNAIFKRLNFPYKICSKQSPRKARQTHWYICL